MWDARTLGSAAFGATGAGVGAGAGAAVEAGAAAAGSGIGVTRSSTGVVRRPQPAIEAAATVSERSHPRMGAQTLFDAGRLAKP